jgi:sulfoxide reductase heme-binding subunit YedZ
MIGVGAFCYLAAHFSLYIADQSFDPVKVVIEVAARLYLTIGFVALIGMAVLAATSTDGMVRRLGGLRWRRLHGIVYAVALLALIHYFQQTKADVSVPIYTAGLFGWLMTYRILAWWRGMPELSTPGLVGLAVVVGALTFAGEAIGIGIKFAVSPLRVLEAAWDFDPETIRPGWLVLASGLAVALLEFGRTRWRERVRAGEQLGARAVESRL